MEFLRICAERMAERGDMAELGGLGDFPLRKPSFVLALAQASEQHGNGLQSASEANLTKIKTFAQEHGIPLGVWKNPAVAGSKLALRLEPLQQTRSITGVEFLRKLVAKPNRRKEVFITEVNDDNSGGLVERATLSNLVEMSTDASVAEDYEITLPQRTSSPPKAWRSDLMLRLTLLVMAIMVSVAVGAYAVGRFVYRRKGTSLSNLAGKDIE